MSVCFCLVKIYVKDPDKSSGRDELEGGAGTSGTALTGSEASFLRQAGVSRVQCQCRLGSCATNTDNSEECRKDAQMALMARVTVTWQMSKCNWCHFMVKWSSNFVCGFDIFRPLPSVSGAVLCISTRGESPDQGLSVQIHYQSSSKTISGRGDKYRGNDDSKECIFRNVIVVLKDSSHLLLRRLKRMDDTDEVILIVHNHLWYWWPIQSCLHQMSK